MHFRFERSMTFHCRTVWFRATFQQFCNNRHQNPKTQTPTLALVQPDNHGLISAMLLCAVIGIAFVDCAVWLLSSAHCHPSKRLTPHHTDVISAANYNFWWLGEETWYIFVVSAVPRSQSVHDKHMKCQSKPSEWDALSVGDVTCAPLVPEGALCHHVALGPVIHQIPKWDWVLLCYPFIS